MNWLLNIFGCRQIYENYMCWHTINVHLAGIIKPSGTHWEKASKILFNVDLELWFSDKDAASCCKSFSVVASHFNHLSFATSEKDCQRRGVKGRKIGCANCEMRRGACLSCFSLSVCLSTHTTFWLFSPLTNLPIYLHPIPFSLASIESSPPFHPYPLFCMSNLVP